MNAMPANGEVTTTSYSLTASYTIDLDTGTIGGGPQLAIDLHYENVDGTERYLVPWYGALIANLGVVDFDSVVDASAYTLSSEPVNASLNNNTIPVGAVLIVKTNMGNYSKLRIDSYPDPLNFTVVFQDDGSPVVPELSPMATVALFLGATLVVAIVYPRKHESMKSGVKKP